MPIFRKEPSTEPEKSAPLVKAEPESGPARSPEKREEKAKLQIYSGPPTAVPESKEKSRIARWQKILDYHDQSGWQSDFGGPRATKMERVLEEFYAEIFCKDVDELTAFQRWEENVEMRSAGQQRHIDWLLVMIVNGWSHLNPEREAKAPTFEPVPHDQMQQLFRFRPTPNDGHLEKYGIAQLAAYWKENMIDLGLDVFAIIDAPKTVYPFGMGKSTLMMEVLGAMAHVLDCDFDPRLDIDYQVDYPRVVRFMNDHTKGIVRGIDEIEEIWGRRNSMSGDQPEDMRRLSLKRKDAQVWIGNAANVFRLDKDIFEKKATHLVRIPDEGRESIKRGWGRAIVYEKGYDNEEKDVWGNSDTTPGIMEVRWVDLPAPPKTVYHACIDYTNKNVNEILKKHRSPLDRLVMEEDPNWYRGTLEEWAKSGGDWNPPLDGGKSDN